VGLQAGIDNVVRMAEKFHFGERTGLPTRQETPGIFPSLARVHSDWYEGDSANICFGQGEMAVTPMQMAVAYAAIANGGTILWPRLVERIEDPVSGESLTNYPSGLVRDHLGVSTRSLKILHDAMLAETEDPEGTGRPAAVPGLRICGKTGTAEIMDTHNRKIGRTTWFASFAPYEHPCYAVVVMVENGTFGGPTCAPIAHDIYEAILKSNKTTMPAVAALPHGESVN
jgi:penicillin-binding protein 2